MSTEYSPEQLAELLSTPEDVVHPPTAQQRAIIVAPPDRPALVVAGAGSGKTETMASRVVHLIANGLVAPADALGLTFTRKAAGELADRIARRLERLRRAGVLGDTEAFEQPTVATYNAWAGSIYREHALRIGQEPDAQVIGEAASWLLARRVVVEHGDRALADLEQSLGQLTDAVLRLSNAMTDHLVTAERLSAFLDEFLDGDELPPLGLKGIDGEYEGDRRHVGALRRLLPLVDHYQEAKRRRGVIEFSDQVASALAICQQVPSAVEELRARHRVVILDEYQDTSVIQSRLLSTLFAGTGVMAVGDPNQAIYGWRGASAANLEGFAREFQGEQAEGSVPTFQLTTSWRNPPTVLRGANRIAEPLRRGRVQVEELTPRPGAVDGVNSVVYPETVDEEADAVAAWLRERIAARTRDDGAVPTAAILLRKRAHMERFAGALRRAGLPVRIVGGGGLLSEPEIVDLVATLRVLVDPDAGSALIRVLTGARWRLGLADVQALRSLAAWLRERDSAQQRLPAEVTTRMRESGIPSDGASIVDALDALVGLPAGHSALRDFSEAGLHRLRAAGVELRRLRSRLGLPLPELVGLVEETLRLDIEVAANELRPIGPSALRAFRREVEGFTQVDDRASLSSLLAWIDRAADDDREMSPDAPPSEPGVVQITTVHGAKGLEWDVVALPRLVEEEFPGKAKHGRDWLRFGQLPAELRGDAAELPRFAWRGATTRREYAAAFKSYADSLAERHEQEERRLAYVAVTRTAGDLLLAGSWWGGQRKPRQPSVYLRELEGILAPTLPTEPTTTEPPSELGQPDLAWPRPPLGDREARVERAAGLVDAELASLRQRRDADESADHEPVDVELLADAPWADDLVLLLGEHAERRGAITIAPPGRVPASGFKRWMSDPAGQLRAALRPMPERPYTATRLGTLFHDWVEARYRRLHPEALFDLDELTGEADDELRGLAPADAAQLAQLKATFERSRWANRRPLAVERATDLPLGDVTIPCKIDAVFPDETDPDRVVVVDWKTGRIPTDAESIAMLDYQLDLYRLAWSSATGTPLTHIDARLYFVAADQEIEPAGVRDADELAAQWQAAMARLGTA